MLQSVNLTFKILLFVVKLLKNIKKYNNKSILLMVVKLNYKLSLNLF